MKKELTEEEKLRRKERAASRRAKKKEAKAAEEAQKAAKKAARKRRAEERKRAFDRKECQLKNIYIGKNLRNTDLELINYPFYTTSMNSEVKLDVDDNNIIRSVKLTRL